MIPPRLCATNMTGSCRVSLASEHSDWPQPYLFHLSLELDGEVLSVLRYAVLVVRAKQVRDHVRVVSVRPYSRVGRVGREQLVRPERVASTLVVNVLLLLAAEQGSQGLRRGYRDLAVLSIVAPRPLRVASEPVHEDNACQCQSLV